MLSRSLTIGRAIVLLVTIAALLGVVPASPAGAADTSRPSKPTGLSAQVQASGVALSWSRSADDVGVTGYEIIRNGKVIGSANGTRWTDRTAANNTDYWYRVQARDQAGNRSERSMWVMASTGNGANGPSKVTGLRGTTSGGNIALNWSASSAPAGIANYKVTRSGKVIATANGTSWTDTNVTAGKDYWYRITAVDNNGRSSTISEWVKITAGAASRVVPEPPNPGPVNPVAPDLPPNIAPPNGWTMVWNDEFNGTSLDTSKWNIETSNFGHPNGTEHCYTPNNVVVSGGSLSLVARDENARCSGTNKEYTSGMIHTKNKVDWTYGRFEVRARLTIGKGMFPAVWLSSADKRWGSWPRSGEIDIVEQIGQRPNIIAGSLHWGTLGDPKRKVTEYFSPTRLTDAFHTYAIEWEPGVVRWYIDDELYATSTVADGWFVPGGGVSGAPFNQDFFLIMNLSVGHDWPGSPDASTGLPRDLKIDYVRVYKR